MRCPLLAIVLGTVLLTACSEGEWPKAKPDLYNWYGSESDEKTVHQRFEGASVKPLGTKDDVTQIDDIILNNREHACTKVQQLRWLNSTNVMAKAGIYGPNLGSSEYTFVLKKENGAWKIVACFMEWIS